MRWRVTLVAEGEPGQSVEHEIASVERDDRITPATLACDRSTGADRGRAERPVPGLHDDATADVELPEHLRVGKVATLHPWMARAVATNIHELQRFVRTLRRDLGAVEGAVRERWSNGPVEGQINRLKMLRRQMYSRAGVELLRARLLPMPCSSPR
jgi:transposase